MLTDDELKTVNAVHRRVFSIFEYKTDLEKFGKLEHWQDPKQLKEALDKGVLVGDCDDFALACRFLLREKGIQSRLVMCFIGDEGHLVLEVQGYILDNRHDRVKRIDELSYEWVKMSGYNDGDDWMSIEK
jgi:predicted transglutaminase-like cysteine proteinase